MVARLPVIGDWLAAAAERGQPLPSRLANLAVYHLLFVNIGWAVLNLLPVPPLDGGTIVLEGLRAAGVSAAVSIASLFGLLIAGTIALWAFQRQDLYLAVMFALLAYGCFQRLSQPRINS
jgi:membrane-associated protease RseP (regulator of RpoE activity)